MAVLRSTISKHAGAASQGTRGSFASFADWQGLDLVERTVLIGMQSPVNPCGIYSNEGLQSGRVTM